MYLVSKDICRALGAILLALALSVTLMVGVAEAESPTGCNADESDVNIITDKLLAADGEVITFSVTAGNTGTNGCDITNRSMTLTLPDGSFTTFGPFNYPFPSGIAAVGSAPYVADSADLSGNVWTANVSWDGTLKAVTDLPSSGSKNISVVQVLPLEVTKDAVPATEIGYRWQIEKTVTPEVWDLFDGDSGTSEYTINLTKTEASETNKVTGTISIHNPNASFAATITSVDDVIEGGINASVECGVAFPHELSAGDTLECTYSADLPDDATRVNTATVETSGTVPGGEGTADVDFSNVIPTLVGDSIDVDDTFDEGDATDISNSTSYNYSRTFSCGADEGQIDNTATIVQTGASDDASVQVNCYDLEVEKTAVGSYDLKWDWTIDKSADQTDLLLQAGQIFTVNYEVTVGAQSTPSNGSVSGKITITNNHPSKDADLTGVIDELDGSGTAVSCPSLVVPAGGTLECDYGPVETDAEVNVATATQQNYSYDKDMNPTPDGTTDYSGQTNVNYSLGEEVDECIDVTDDNIGLLGTVCADELPWTHNYSLDFGTEGEVDVVLECGENEHPNIADFITNDTGATGSDTWTVYPEVQCQLGCTLTQGYWKTHSDQGPAPYDSEGWGLLGDFDGDAADEEEQESWLPWNVSWYDAFWTPPKKGNVWYKLVHQFQAAYLNVANGASTPTDVTDALLSAEAWLKANDPASIPKGKDAKDANGWAGLLGSYNEGLVGPGHCDEDSSSAN